VQHEGEERKNGYRLEPKEAQRDILMVYGLRCFPLCCTMLPAVPHQERLRFNFQLAQPLRPVGYWYSMVLSSWYHHRQQFLQPAAPLHSNFVCDYLDWTLTKLSNFALEQAGLAPF
jgi:hypothetical protein